MRRRLSAALPELFSCLVSKLSWPAILVQFLANNPTGGVPVPSLPAKVIPLPVCMSTRVSMMCVCVRACACVCVCVRACVRVCAVRARV